MNAKTEIKDLLTDFENYIKKVLKDSTVPKKYQEVAVLVGIFEVQERDGHTSFVSLVRHLDGRITKNNIEKILDELRNNYRIEYYSKMTIGERLEIFIGLSDAVEESIKQFLKSQEQVELADYLVVALKMLEFEENGERVWFSKLVESLGETFSGGGVAVSLNILRDCDWLLIDNKYVEPSTGYTEMLYYLTKNGKEKMTEIRDFING